MDERIILKGLHHEQGVIHVARDVAGQDGIPYVAAPHRQTLALALFQVTAPHARPSPVSGKHPPACFHLVVDVHEMGSPPKPARELSLR